MVRGMAAACDTCRALLPCYVEPANRLEKTVAMSIAADNAARFDSIAKGWDEEPRRVQAAAAIAHAMMLALQPQADETALEFGCGTGLITTRLAPHLLAMTAMDGSAGMLDVLRQKCADPALHNLNLIHGQVPDDLPDGPFDFILSSLTLHHIADVPAVLRAVGARLAPGGRVAFADLDAEDGSFHGDVPGVAHHGFERAELERWLHEADYSEVKFTTAHTITRTRDDGTTRDYPLFLVVAQRPMPA